MSKLRTNKSGIEAFVEAYLSKFRNAGNRRRERKFLEKAVKQIDFFLNPPCCDDPDSTVEYSRLDNALTIFIKAQLAIPSFNRRRYRKSLERAKSLLNRVLRGCCGDMVTILVDEESDWDFENNRTEMAPSEGSTIFIQICGEAWEQLDVIFSGIEGNNFTLEELLEEQIQPYIESNYPEYLPLYLSDDKSYIITSKAVSEDCEQMFISICTDSQYVMPCANPSA